MRTVQELRASPFEPAQSFDSLAGLPNASERACGHENDDSSTCFKATPTPHGTMLASQTTRGRALPGITMGRADIRLHTVHGRFPSLLNSRQNSRHSASSATSNPAQAARSPSDTSHHLAKHDKKPLRQAARVAYVRDKIEGSPVLVCPNDDARAFDIVVDIRNDKPQNREAAITLAKQVLVGR